MEWNHCVGWWSKCYLAGKPGMAHRLPHLFPSPELAKPMCPMFPHICLSHIILVSAGVNGNNCFRLNFQILVHCVTLKDPTVGQLEWKHRSKVWKTLLSKCLLTWICTFFWYLHTYYIVSFRLDRAFKKRLFKYLYTLHSGWVLEA